MRLTVGLVQPMLCLAQLVSARSYCTRTFHSIIVNNNTLFVDGGEMRYLEDNNTITAYAIRDLETVDLSKSWSNTDANLFNSIAKPVNVSDVDSSPTYLNEGTIWSDGSTLFFYGGQISGRAGPSDAPPVETWKYSIASNTWDNQGFGGVPIMRLSQGGSAYSSAGKGYYLGGIISPGGNPVIYGTPGADNYIVSGMLILDEKTLTWSNLSTTDVNTYGTIASGYMNIIEGVGSQGILVAFGGYTRQAGQKLSPLASSQNNPSYQNPMELVSIYDIANNTWYIQRTSGDVPEWRMYGCSVTVAAPDASSFFIYVFGGMGDTVETSDGNVYVLSMPSFRWIRVTNDTDIRILHQCTMAGKHTMLTVGGTIPTDNAEYEPEPANCDSGTFASGLGIFDLRSHSWLSRYDATDDGEYTVNAKISAVIGGNETGGATLKTPLSGFNDPNIQALFQRASTSTPTATSVAEPSSTTSSAASASESKDQSPKSKSMSGGAIAGTVIGVVAGVSLLAASAFLCLTRRRRRSQTPAYDHYNHISQPPQKALVQLDTTNPAFELGKNGEPFQQPAELRASVPMRPNRPVAELDAWSGPRI